MREAGNHIRFNDDLFKTGAVRVGPDACQRVIEPVPETTSEGRHLHSAALPVFLEYLGSVVEHHVVPARIRTLVGHRIGQISLAQIGEAGQQHRRGHESGAHMVVRCGNFLHQLVEDQRSLVVIDQTQAKRHKLRGLAILAIFTGGRVEERCVEGRFDACGQFGITFGLIGVAQQSRRFRGDERAVIVTDGRGQRRQLMEQWVERLSSFLKLPPKSIGCIGAGRNKPTGKIDVAIMQSLIHEGKVDDRVGAYGYVIADECHHLASPNYAQVAGQTKARFFTGLTATLIRKDGHHPLVQMLCGPVRFRVDARQQAHQRPFTHSILVRPTAYIPPEQLEKDRRLQFQALYDGLISCRPRNELIVQDVIASAQQGRSPIVLTQRTEHLESLQALLEPAIKHLLVLRGGMGRKELKVLLARLASIPADEERVLLATGHYLGEGFDDARLDTLFLTLPVSWRGTIAQYAGRLHRLHEAKKEVRIYDYADLNVPMLARMFDKRCKGYEAIGYSILLPASAVPGWPTEVPLPVEPEWKRDYAATVQRLIRDGVDTHLGNLFMHAARTYPPDTEGVGRARSASEAFFFQRLETLPETAGRFRLNQILPIPFDNYGQMEVDFLFPEAKLVIELDGPHHFSDQEAYRRDRRKDACLQEQGYFVLRFLCDDVGKQLDHVLDTVLRVLSRRNRRPA